MKFSDLGHVLFRKKTVGPTFFHSSLKRCMNVVDVTFLGTGHIIGAGIWIMSGKILNETGPGMILSYVFSGIVAFLAALSYAEFGGRIPKAGSVYSYGYITMGEFWAFLVGWDLLLETILGAAALAVAWSRYLDMLLPNSKSISMVRDMTVTNIVSERVDYVAAALIITLCIFILLGVRTSTIVNNIFNVVNLSIIAVIVSFGLTFADLRLWTDFEYVKQKCINMSNQHASENVFSSNSTFSPFLPFGFSSILNASVVGYFAFIGFETMTSAGEEVKDPRKTMPLGIISAMVIVTLTYISMTVTLSLMVPFCEAKPAPFAQFFGEKNYVWAKYLSSAGAMCSMTSVLYGFLFCLPRAVYAMASDGLLFRFLSYVHPRTKVPVVALIVFGLLAAIPALFFRLEFLTELVSIGTLTAFNVMSCSVIILRYRPDSCGISTTMTLTDEYNVGQLKPNFLWLDRIFGRFQSGSAVGWLTAAMIPFLIGLSLTIHFYANLQDSRVTLLVICCVAIFLCLFCICAHQKSNAETLYFKVSVLAIIRYLVGQQLCTHQR